jgi:hypothetical protein
VSSWSRCVYKEQTTANLLLYLSTHQTPVYETGPVCFLQFARSRPFPLGSPVFSKSASMEFPFLLALMGIFRLAVATSSENCTFDGISPSRTLTWCPCGNGFFCAKLDVKSFSPIILPCMLTLFSRYRLIIRILLLVELLFPWSNTPPNPILLMDLIKDKSF